VQINLQFIIFSCAETRERKVASTSFEQCRSCLEFSRDTKGKLQYKLELIVARDATTKFPTPDEGPSLETSKLAKTVKK
jgi:hypothetical protein